MILQYTLFSFFLIVCTACGGTRNAKAPPINQKTVLNEILQETQLQLPSDSIVLAAGDAGGSVDGTNYYKWLVLTKSKVTPPASLYRKCSSTKKTDHLDTCSAVLKLNVPTGYIINGKMVEAIDYDLVNRIKAEIRVSVFIYSNRDKYIYIQYFGL